MKLYLITISNGDSFYIIHTDPTSAYSVLREYLDNKKIGLKKERELKTVELLADAENSKLIVCNPNS